MFSCVPHAHLSPADLLAPPVAFEARLPPLQPKTSAKLSMLAAGNGSLFAGPAVNGGLLQWGRPEGNMRRPQDVEAEHGQQASIFCLRSARRLHGLGYVAPAALPIKLVLPPAQCQDTTHPLLAATSPGCFPPHTQQLPCPPLPVCPPFLVCRESWAG